MRCLILVPLMALATLVSCNEGSNETVNEAEPGPDAILTKDGEQARASDPIGQDNQNVNEAEFQQDLAYFFSNSERGATLSFGVPRTDNIALTLRCPPSEMGKTVLVNFNRPETVVKERPKRITLRAGDAEERLAIRTRENQLGTTVEIATSPTGSVMEEYRNGSSLELTYGDETMQIPSRSSDRAIDRFFNACTT